MAGNTTGAALVAAGRLGLSAEAYLAKVAGGEKWCGRCRSWHPRAAFGLDRARRDGLAAECRESRSLRTRRPPHHHRPRINPKSGRPGPVAAPARDGDRKQARQRVNVEVRTGRRPHPNALPCTDCGHVWAPGERRHEYDHFRGYGAAHHLEVQSVCTTCHAAREQQRGVRRG